MTWRQLLARAAEELKQAGVAEYELDAWYLFSDIFSVSRADWFLRRDREVGCGDLREEPAGDGGGPEVGSQKSDLPEAGLQKSDLPEIDAPEADPSEVVSQETLQMRRFREAIRLRCSRIPLQQITGHQEFMGLDFQVNEHVLIPRQDTEVLVETVLDELSDIYRRVSDTRASKTGDAGDTPNSTGEPRRISILDMCAGSGCIGISLERLSRRPMEVLAADISGEAIAVAKRNSERLGCEHYRIIRSDLFEAVEGTFDVIVSNPPYIPSAVIGTLDDEVRLHEPRLALDGEADGLVFYRRIAAQAAGRLNRGGRIYFEIGYDQGEAVSDILAAEGFRHIRVIRDLAGLDRVVAAQLPEGVD